MNREERAKIFMPFDTLKGLREELAEREQKRVRVERVELDETQKAEISSALNLIKKGDEVKITHYEMGSYVSKLYKIKKIDEIMRVVITFDRKIYFDDLYAVEFPEIKE